MMISLFMLKLRMLKIKAKVVLLKVNFKQFHVCYNIHCVYVHVLKIRMGFNKIKKLICGTIKTYLKMFYCKHFFWLSHFSIQSPYQIHFRN